MNVLVTGATGFLGKVLVKKLKSLNMEVYECNTTTANLINYRNLDVFDGVDFDFIFHLAANTKAGDWCIYNSGTQWITNQLINTNIIKFWAEKHPKAKMVAVGTSCSYDPKVPLVESKYETGTPDDNLYYYAHTKRMLLTGLRALEKQHHLDWLYVIPSTLYGPGYGKTDNHFIFDLVRKIYGGKHYGDSVDLWGDGHQKRELIHVNDFVELLTKVLYRKNEVINIGTGVEHSIRRYAGIISNLVDYDHENINYDTSKFVGVKSKKLDINKLKTYVSDFKFTDIETGIKELVDWEKLQHEKKILADTIRVS
tara:strand:- start:2187 stop:3119 length:933 start_codon:yes stop_codon:yes gene_type:complete